MDPNTCAVCRMAEVELHPVDGRRFRCLICKPWTRNIPNNQYGQCSITSNLERLGYPDISAIREKAIEIHSQESPMTTSLGFCPLNIPENGPEKDKHWSRLIQMISLSHSLGWRDRFEKNVDLDEDTIELIMDVIRSFGVKYLPKSNRQKELLANIIGGAFGQDVKDEMIARILQWNSSQEFLSDDDALSRSFRWLKEIVGNLDNNRVWFTEFGIIVIGTSGNVYEIVPHNLRPRYRVTLPELGMGVCLNSISRDEPFGDTLANLVLALYNDELSAQRIPLLEAVLPKPASEAADVSDTLCVSCAREMIDGDYTSNPMLAPRSTVNPTVCKTCNAGCRLPEGAEQPGDD